MQPDGSELLALWREAGAWWLDENPHEYHRIITSAKKVIEKSHVLPPLDSSTRSDVGNIVRHWRISDDKVERARHPYEVPTKRTFSHKKEPYALLHLQSGYSFGRSTIQACSLSHLEECSSYTAVLLADYFSLTGAVEFARGQQDFKPLVGASFEMEEGGELVLVARTSKGYRNLSRLITECHLNEPRLYPLCNWERLEDHAEDLLCLTGGDRGPINRLISRSNPNAAVKYLDRLIALYGRENVFVQVEFSYLPWQLTVNQSLIQLADQLKLVAVAGGQITHHQPGHFPAQDMMVCVETLCQIDEVIGRKPVRHPDQPAARHLPMRALNAERYLRSPKELCDLFQGQPHLVQNTLRVSDRCDTNVLPDRTTLPQFCENEAALLAQIVDQRAKELPQYQKRRTRLNKELARIKSRGFSGHFLVAWDMCRWAKEQGIVLSGRGSVVDSAVAYCLGLSRIDAFEHNLYFDRFLPGDGSKRPDIDIDFEARRRDDVRNYLSNRYGKEHVATVGAVGTYGTRGIIREVGKVMGIPQEDLSYLIKRLHGSVTPEGLEREIENKPELRDSEIPRERFRWVFRLAEVLMEVPRNLRTHSSGVVISRDPIADTVPVVHSGADGVNIIQWDKRSAKHYFDKFDVLCLRGNDVLSDTQDRIRIQSPTFGIEELPLDDEEVFRAMRAGELIGVPQSASPAMRQAHIRLGTENLKDTSIIQAGIRPGVGGAVKLNELIARRKGKPYVFIDESLRRILEPTYGIIVFQEQVDDLLKTFAGYNPGKAEETREDIYKKRRQQDVDRIHSEVIDSIKSNGYSEEVAKEVYELVAQFQGYGFAEGHALAFADISIRSVHSQQNYPSEYFSALLDAQPAGYYGPCTLVNEARTRGVTILPPSVNSSGLKYRVEDTVAEDPKIKIPSGGIRVSLPQIKGLSKQTREKINEEQRTPFTSLFDFVARVRPDRDEMEVLILCGALDELHENRRALLWALPSAIRYAAGVIDPATGLPLSIPEPDLPTGIQDFTKEEKAIYERRVLELDVKHHLMAFERERVAAKGAKTSAEASRLPHKTRAFVVGNPIRLRFPPTSSGKRVMFFDLEDESGLLNVTCFNETYLRDGHTVICSKYITVFGEAQVRDGHVAFLASRIFPYNPLLEKIGAQAGPLPITTADFLVA